MKLKKLFPFGLGIGAGVAAVVCLETFDDPANVVGFSNPNYSQTIEPDHNYVPQEAANSIGSDGDNRSPVTYKESKFTSIGRLEWNNYNFSELCSASLAEIEGYDSEFPIIVTAKHCVTYNGMIANPADLYFTMSYISSTSGEIEVVNYSAYEIYNDPHSDLAFVKLSSSYIPEEISPIQFQITNQVENVVSKLTSYGYSGDLYGLNKSDGKLYKAGFENIHTEEGGEYRGVFVATDADVAQGASGGPVVDSNGVAVAVNSYVGRGYTGAAALMDYQIKLIPFLNAEEPQNETCAIVDASKLNVRSGPATDFDKVASLPNGITVEILGSYEDWAVINLGPRGYGFASKEYLRSTVCPL